MQWNSLSRELCDKSSFPNSPPACLVWENRSGRILQEIVQTAPDVLCCQETADFEWLSSELSKLGYDGHFHRRRALTYRIGVPCPKKII